MLRPRTNPWSYHFSVYHRPGIEGAVVHYSPGQILKYSRQLEEKDLGLAMEKVYDPDHDPLETTSLKLKIKSDLLSEFRRQGDKHFINSADGPN